MFAVKTRPLGNNHQALAAHEEGPAAPLQRSVSHPSAGSAAADVLASDLNAFKLEDEGAPLAAACQRALDVLGSPSKRNARTRKLAEIDRYYKKNQGTHRTSLDEPKMRRTQSKSCLTTPR